MPTETILLSLLLVLPGLGVTILALPPPALEPATRLALTFGLGYATWALVAFALALFGALSTTALVVSMSLATLIAWAIGLRRAGAGTVRALVREVRACSWEMALGLAAVAAVAVVRLLLDPTVNLPAITAFRYWGDALEIADLGGLPSQSLQYGSFHASANSKVLLNCFNAAVALVVGRDALPALGALVWTTSLAMAIALWAAGRELGLRWTAPLLPLLVVANQAVLNRSLANDLDVYRAESVGRLIALCAFVAGLRALSGRGGGVHGVVAGLLGGVGVVTHAIPMIVVAALLGTYLIARISIAHGPRRILRSALLMGAAAGAVAAFVLAVTPGDLGFEGAAAPSGYERTGVRFDPTFFLLRGTREPPDLPVDVVPDLFVASAFGAPEATAATAEAPVAWQIVFVAASVMAIAMLSWFPHVLRPIGVVAVGSAVAMVGVAQFFAQRFDNWVLVTFGTRRLFDYSSIPFLLLALGLLEALLAWLAGRRPRWVRPAAASLVALTVLGVVPSGIDPHPEGWQRHGARGVALVDWVSRHTSCDATILANQRTSGVFKVMTGRVALLEGMTPYLRPDLLRDVVRLLRSTQRFFARPTQERSFLTRHGVDYVIQLRGLRLGHVVRGTGRDLEVPTLLEAAWDRPDATIYRVRPAARDEKGSRAPSAPGYSCRRTPVSG